MATVVHDRPYHERRTQERRRISEYLGLRTAEGLRVSWGGIWAGVLSAVGLLILLTALGLAVGISALQPGETEGSTVGMGAGIWAGSRCCSRCFSAAWFRRAWARSPTAPRGFSRARWCGW
jgi:hypothetical protein